MSDDPRYRTAFAAKNEAVYYALSYTAFEDFDEDIEHFDEDIEDVDEDIDDFHKDIEGFEEYIEDFNEVIEDFHEVVGATDILALARFFFWKFTIDNEVLV